MFKKKFKKQEKRLKNSFRYAWNGILLCFKHEANMKIHFAFLNIVLVLGLIVKLSWLEWIICFVLFVLVISAELINTAIETTVDLVTKEINPKAKIAKDTAAGAVLFAAFFAAAIGIMIFLPKIILLIKVS